jgi:hypothetical protein
MPGADDRDLPDELLARQCRWDAFRGPGPGGQKRNKTSSAVRVTHEPTGISATAAEMRSQAGNRTLAWDRLRLALVIELRRPVSVLNEWVAPEWFEQVRRRERVALARKDPRFRQTVGLVLDVLHAQGYSVSDAAGVLGLTTSTLVEFLFLDDTVRQAVNRHRQVQGLRALVGK